MNHSTKSASTTRVAYSLIGLLLLAQALLSVAPRETVGQENLSFSELAVRNIDPVEAKAQISRIMGDSVEVIADREGRRLLLRGVGGFEFPATSSKPSTSRMDLQDKLKSLLALQRPRHLRFQRHSIRK